MPDAQSSERRHFPEEDGGYTGQELELECQQLLRYQGYIAILEDDHIMGEDGKEKTSLDMLINGSRADIRSITVNGENTLRNVIKTKNLQLVKYNFQNRTRHDTLILHYHDFSLWDIDKILKALEFVPTLVNHFQLRRVICTINLNNATEDVWRSINQLRSPWISIMVVKAKRLLRIQSSHKSTRRIIFERHISKRYGSAIVIIYLR